MRSTMPLQVFGFRAGGLGVKAQRSGFFGLGPIRLAHRIGRHAFTPPPIRTHSKTGQSLHSLLVHVLDRFHLPSAPK